MGAEEIRARSRRPIEPEEIPYLEAFGRVLGDLRRQSGLTQAQLSEAAFVSKGYVTYLENGWRRPRRTTLERLAMGLCEVNPHLPEPAVLVAELTDILGPALAPPSKYVERVERRSGRRMRRKAAMWAYIDEEAERRARALAPEIAAAYVHRWRRTGEWPA